MSFRTVNGNDFTEDGWRCCNRDACDLVRIPGLTLVDTAPLRQGAPLTILGAWLFWYDRNVEEITSPVWGWSLNNDVLGKPGENNGSNHLSATAVDVNAPKYPWGSRVMPQHLIDKVEEGLRLFEDSVFWGRGWSKPDEMHYQMHWPEGDPRNAAFAQKLLGGHLGIYQQGLPSPSPAGYGLPTGARINYGQPGFPDWVYQLAGRFNVRASTYPGHQETDRNEAGFAPNPGHLNRAIDWAGPVGDMQRFADYCLSIRGSLEQVIWQNPNTGQRIGVAGGKDVSSTGYYGSDYGGHQDHVHTRQSQPIPLPGGTAPPPPPPQLSEQERNALLIINETRHRNYNRDESIACISTGIQESQLRQGATDSTSHRGIYQQDGGYPNRETAEGNIAGFLDRLDAKRRSPGASPDIWLNIFWLQQRPSDPSADTAYARGRKGYLTEIKSRLSAATDYYNRLATIGPPPTEGFLMALSDQQQRELYDTVCGQRRSNSPFRALGQGNIGNMRDVIGNIDGSEHVEIVEFMASLGHPDFLALLREIAAADPIQYPDRQKDRLLAQAVLAKVAAPQQMDPQPAQAVAVVNGTNSVSRELAAAYAEIAELRRETDRLIAEAAARTPEPAAAAPVIWRDVETPPLNGSASTNLGDIVKTVVDAVEQLKLADALTIQDRATLAASIKILEMKNGSTL